VLDKINASLIPLLFKPFVKFDIAYSPPPLGDICVLSKSHKLGSILGQNTISKNSRSMSILITPLRISKLSLTISRKSWSEIRYLLIINIIRYILNKLGCSSVSLKNISSKNWWWWCGGTGDTGATRGGGQESSPHKTPRKRPPM
jgi:hypothetical protein